MASKGTRCLPADFGGCLPDKSRFELRERWGNSLASLRGCSVSGEAIGMTWISELFLSFFCSTWVSFEAGTFSSPFSRPVSSLPNVAILILSSLRDTPELRRAVTADWAVDTPEPRLTNVVDRWPAELFFKLPSLAWSTREEPKDVNS